MFLSRGWIKRLGGTLQKDLSYAIVPVFEGEIRRLYKEAQLAYIISDERNPTNHPIYAINTNFGACILHIEESQLASMQLRKSVFQITKEEGAQIWDMFFDGDFSKEVAGAEYEDLILGLNATKEMGIKGLKVFGDADLIIQQVNKTFQAKHPRLKEYRDEVWKLKDSFNSFNISYIPRMKNQLVDSLTMSASTFIPPLPPI
eukprot:PITA_07164